MNIDSVLSYDVIIIGDGAAGLRAAIEANRYGVNVAVVSKNKSGDPHTTLARGGINAALGTMDPQDNWMIHAVDTLREGGFIGDYEKVNILCKSAYDAAMELVKWGARFHREKDGRLTQRFFGAHTYRRTLFYEDQTGKEIIRVLSKQVNKSKIKIINDLYIIKLVTTDLKTTDKSKVNSTETEQVQNKEIIGAVGIDLKRKRFVRLNCKSLILATGGYTRVYSISSSRIFENYGDGMSLAFDIGVDLADMEMVQFHPTGMVWPKKAAGTLATEAIRGEGGILTNSQGERFMKKYYPDRMELGPRDVVARAIFEEISSGKGTEHGGVWLDITHLSKEEILDRLSTMYEQFKELDNIDISKDKMEVAPTAHYSMGGIVVDTKCQTKIKGLYAAGEVISQIHGANRLGGNSLLDTMVFGKIAGSEAAMYSKYLSNEKLDNADSSKHHLPNHQFTDFEYKIYQIKEPKVFRGKIQKIMKEKVGIIRNKQQLLEGLKMIVEMQKQFFLKDSAKNFKIEDHDENIENLKLNLEIKSSLIICEAIIKSALLREESRGAHYRSDFPKTDDINWKINIYCRNTNGEKHQMDLFKVNVKKIKGPLVDLVKSHKKSEHHREFE